MKARDNPFRVERVRELPYLFPESLTAAKFFDVVRRSGFRGAIIGPHGAGKTTLLEVLMSEMSSHSIAHSHLRLREESHFVRTRRIREWLRSTPAESVLILDSAGLLHWWQWWIVRWKSRNYAGLIITEHEPGKLPALIKCQPDFSTFVVLVRRLWGEKTSSESALRELFDRHHGNVRDCFRELYDLCAAVPDESTELNSKARFH